jgi:hypothetical protein
MTALQIDLAQACVNRDSVVDMGDYILYAGPDGLCAVSGTEGRVVTKGLISPVQWNEDFAPTTIKAFKYEGTYVAFYDDGSVHKGWVYDPRADEAAISTITSENTVYAGWTNSRDGELYILEAITAGSNRRIKKWRGDIGNSEFDHKQLIWKSKEIVLPQPTSMGWVYVLADYYPLSTYSSGTLSWTYVLQVRVWADGSLLANYQITKGNGDTYSVRVNTPSGLTSSAMAEPIVRLPAKLARKWEVEVRSYHPVREICIAQTMDELKST